MRVSITFTEVRVPASAPVDEANAAVPVAAEDAAALDAAVAAGAVPKGKRGQLSV